MTEMSKEMEEYFRQIERNIERCYDIAGRARKKGYDPETKVNIPLAKNMAERVEGLISAVAPQLVGSGMSKKIVELEKEFSPLDWRVGFRIAEEVAKEKFCKFKDKIEAMEVGIRTGFAYLTGGIVSAPLEGFIELKTKRRKDGGEYFSVFYAGPIRGAGGTAAATSVLLSDYVRIKMGYATYDPQEEEINRYVTEVYDYHERITNLQYLPSEEELRFLLKHIPVEVNGDPTERIDVSNYKDLPRVETNLIRGGICLVLAEGVAQKAAKLWKRVSNWGSDFGLEWGFLEEFLDLQKKIKAKSQGAGEGEEKPKLTPNFTFINDLVAGRPVLTHPMREFGFRLRYGRSRTTGFSAAGINPSTLQFLNKYIATGTQLKVERPGKAAAITPCDSIEGPIIKLEDGSVIKIDSEKEAKEYVDNFTEILFLGDFLFNYGDFSENGHMLVPAGYCEEWYTQEIEKATVNMFGSLDVVKLSELVEINEDNLSLLFKKPNSRITAEAARRISESLKVPFHPYYTYYWKLISKDEFRQLLEWLQKSEIKTIDNTIQKIILPVDDSKKVLENLGVPHLVVNNEFIVIEKDFARAFNAQLDISKISEIFRQLDELGDNVLEIVNKFSKVKIRDKAGTFIGARMGRPEKSKMRKLTGSPQVLFPVGEEGGRLRCFQSALEVGKIKSNFPIYRCDKCNKDSIYPVCEQCERKTKRVFYCKVCGGVEDEDCKTHGKCMNHTLQEIDIKHYFNAALQKLGNKVYPDLIKGVRGTSNKDHTPEHLIKGILRAENDIFVNKDGTTRFDMSELPITAFKPVEIRTSIEKLKEMGYTHDMKGKPLEDPEQMVELKVQDVILPAGQDALDEQGDEVLSRVCNFVDDLLVKMYGEKPFYDIKEKEDLIGHMVIGLAPHISAGMVGRIIGFSETQGCYAHPMWHAALRRDCDGDECCVMMLMDALLNFSRSFLPDRRGSRTMDAPLVLTATLIPTEVDDQAHGVDTVWKYPLEFYEGALEYKQPWDIKIEQINDRLNTPAQYEGIGFTHDVSNINVGVKCSAYKSLPSMQEKLMGQMEIAERVRAVDTSDVARLVIEKHFLKDTRGNLRKFSMQQFRCVKCNAKFRRPPLVGHCTQCDGGKLIFTISEGSVVKYLEPSISLAEKYELPAYLKQSLELLRRRIEGVFGKEKEKQEGLGKWFG